MLCMFVYILWHQNQMQTYSDKVMAISPSDVIKIICAPLDSLSPTFEWDENSNQALRSSSAIFEIDEDFD